MTPGERSTRTAPSWLAGTSPGALIFWYVGLLMPTFAVKYTYLRDVFAGGLEHALWPPPTGLVSGSPWTHLFVAAATDMLHVAVGLLLLLAIGRGLLRVPMPALVFTTVLTVTVFASLSYVSVQQVRALPSPAMARNTVVWLLEDPGLAIRRALTLRRLVGCLAVVGWAFLASRAAVRARGRPPVRARWLVLAGAAAAGAVLLVQPAASPAGPPSPLDGVWPQVWRALRGEARPALTSLPVRPAPVIRAAFEALSFPAGVPAAGWVAEARPGARRPRHVLMVILETAPLRYYTIDAPGLPTLTRLAGEGIVAERHYASAPFTEWSVYGVLGGVYHPGESLLTDAGGFRTDGLATVLTRHGYETTAIAPGLRRNPVGWNRRLFDQLGFASLRDLLDATGHGASVENERGALGWAVEAIAGAAARGGHAFVCLLTESGHFPWQPEGVAAARGPERMRAVARAFDQQLGAALTALQARGLAGDVLLVVTGDHGIRLRLESEELGEPWRYGAITYRVPLLIHAPGLLDSGVRLRHPTSHVDITPTVLDLLGFSSGDLIHHGRSVLDRRLEDRITFVSGAGIFLTDGFVWRDRLYLRNAATGTVQAIDPDDDTVTPGPAALEPDQVSRTLVAAEGLFRETAALFLQRVASESRR